MQPSSQMAGSFSLQAHSVNRSSYPGGRGSPEVSLGPSSLINRQLSHPNKLRYWHGGGTPVLILPCRRSAGHSCAAVGACANLGGSSEGAVGSTPLVLS